MRQLALDLSTAPAPAFDHFEVAENQLAWHAIQALVARRMGVEEASPLLLWGESGSGKSHLLTAWRNQVESLGGQCGCLSLNEVADFEFSPGWSVLLFDDVDAWGDALQAQAFNWLALTQGMPPAARPTVVATAQLPPSDWNCRDDLRTRLAQGLVFELKPLSEDQRIAILKKAAEVRGLTLSDEVIAYMMRRFSRDLSSLMHLLDHSDQYALEHQRALTVPLIKSMLEHT